MASLCPSPALPPTSAGQDAPPSPVLSSLGVHHFVRHRWVPSERKSRRARNQLQVVAMAPEEDKLTRRNPLDFPIEWERPKPGRRPDVFPKFSPMKTPLPLPMPHDPPEEDDEEEEEKKEEEEEKPDKEGEEEEEHPQKHQ